MRSLTVLYDEQCALCRRCRSWLEQQPTFVPVRFLAAGSSEARERYAELPWLGADLVVVGDDGDAWVGPAAFLVSLWATERYRAWSFRLSGRTLAPLAEHFFHAVSKQRGRFARADAVSVGSADCPDGRCRHRGSGFTDGASAWRPPDDLLAGRAATYVPPPVPWQPPTAVGPRTRS